MKKFFLSAALFFMMVSVSAFPSSISVEDQTATPEDPAVFYVDVQNDMNESALFEIGAFTPKSSWFYIESSRKLNPGENHSFKLTVSPDENSLDERYSFTVYPRSNKGNSDKLQASFRVKRDRTIILEDSNIDKSFLDPGEPVTGEVKIRSLSSSVLKDYSVNLKYENTSSEKTSSPILPGGKRNLEFSLPTNREMRPDKKKLQIDLMLGGEAVESTYKNFSIAEIQNIETNKTGQNNLATTATKITVSNKGNSKINYTVNQTVSNYLTPITGFNRNPDNIEEKSSETVYYFKEELDPGENFSVERKTNFWMPVAALIGILAALTGLKKLRNTVKIEKRAEKTSEGLKISIEVENISDSSFRKVKIKDFVPDIASVNKNFEMASPTVRETNEGTKLTWDIEDLEPGDQRVLQYTIVPKVEVEEGVKLPKAKLIQEDEVIKETKEFTSDFNP